MKNVLVTGGLGFIGSNLVDYIVEHNLAEQVYVIDDLSTGKLEYQNSNAHYYICNIKDVDYDAYPNIDTIFHMGNHARVQMSFENPLHYLIDNTSANATICDYASKQEAFLIYAGSSTRYFDITANPYALSKYFGEQIVELYYKNFKLNGAIARFFNVYGPRETVAKYTPVVEQFRLDYVAGRPLTINGTGEKRRDFTYIQDVIDALLIIAHNRETGFKEYDLGHGKNYSVLELAEMFGGEIQFAPDKRGEAQETLSNPDKYPPGWKAKHRLPDYVEQIKQKPVQHGST